MEAHPDGCSGRVGVGMVYLQSPRLLVTAAFRSAKKGCDSKENREMKTLKTFNRIVENDLIHRVSADEYRDKIKDVYDGRKGALLATASKVSLHIQLGRRLMRTRKFDLRGLKSILDVGSGAGQIAGHLLEFADQDAQITCTDLS